VPLFNRKSEVLETLHDLMAACQASVEGFTRAAGGVQDENLRNQCAASARQRVLFGQELAECLHRMGRRTASEKRHESSDWNELETRIRPPDDASYLAECRAGEEATLRRYDRALARKLQPEIRMMLERHRAAVQRGLAELGSLEIPEKPKASIAASPQSRT
jgi:uncharacterized protein (TIGR02284 family)